LKKTLKLADYEDLINLRDIYSSKTLIFDSKSELVNLLLESLVKDNYKHLSFTDRRSLLRGSLNSLRPNSLGKDEICYLDTLLQMELNEKRVIDTEMITANNTVFVNGTKISVWMGDITSIKIDAIVNAANSQLLGCFHPLHKCIDNAIHSGAGVLLRDDCYKIMQLQNMPEPTGNAKITRGYNLPAKYVLHTVGPIIENKVTPDQEKELENCYTSCLEMCKNMGDIESIAFCCISTGVFGYPQKEASEVAYRTVLNWLKNNPGVLKNIVFNVFTQRDLELYSRLSGKNDGQK